MSLFLTYVLAGFVIALPIGAMTIEMIRQGLKNGFIHGWAVGLGGMTLDLGLILALYFGLASILQYSYIQITMWLLGAVFLAWIAYDSIKHADQDITIAGENPTKSFFSSYRNGLFVAISPANIVFWISVFGAVLTDSYEKTNSTSFILIAAGILVGILLHDLVLLTIVSITRRVMSRSIIKGFSIFAGILLGGFSLYFIYRLITDLMTL